MDKDRNCVWQEELSKNPRCCEFFDEATSNLDVDTKNWWRESVIYYLQIKFVSFITHDSHMAEIANPMCAFLNDPD